MLRALRWNCVALAAALLLALPNVARAQVVANSVTDFPGASNTLPRQGINNWTYGYHVDSVGGAGFSYNAGNFIPFPDNSVAGTSATDFWTNTMWDWHTGNPPWTEISATGGHPNTGGAEHWAIRRWSSEVSGAVNVQFNVAKGAAAGDGTSARVFLNGTQQSAIVIGGGDTTGKTFSVHIPNIKVGDSVDVALDHTGLTGATDGGDGSSYGAIITQVSQQPTKLVAHSINDFPTGAAGLKQGTNGWNYGYHNSAINGAYNATPGGTDDFIAFPDNQGAGTSPTDFWTGTAWDWNAGNPPWTEISAAGGHPNGSNNGQEHLPIRRWVVDEVGVDGSLILESFFAKTNLGGTSIQGLLYHNGTLIDSDVIAGADGQGLLQTYQVFGVKVGDFIDLVLGPDGGDGGDGSNFSLRVFATTPEPATLATWGIAAAALAFGVYRRQRRQPKSS